LALRRLCRRFISRYVTVSLDLARWLGQMVGVASDKISSICNGVDTGVFSPKGSSATPPESWRTGLVIGSVGRLDPIKRFDLLIDAFALVHAEYPQTRLVIVGDGGERANLEQLISRHGLDDAVMLAGRRDNTPEWFRLIDVFALVSRNEGISNTILEAMSSGLPAVVTDVGGNCELVSSGETGTVIPSGDITGLVDALRQYISSDTLRAAHGSASRERVLQEFSLSRMIERYDDLYRTVLRDSKNK
ncbi:MAG: glycosyltransferase, partial [Pseudomonadota bacterium]